MKLAHVTVRNFRSIQECDFDLKSNITAIAGGNESGKSNALLAIYSFLKREQFSHEDKYQLSDAEPNIEITFDSFSQEERSKICEILEIDALEQLVIAKMPAGYKVISPAFQIPQSQTPSGSPHTVAGTEQPASVEEAEAENTAQTTDQTINDETGESQEDVTEAAKESDDDQVEPVPSPEAPVSEEEITDLVIEALPECILISTLEDLIIGRNIELERLFPKKSTEVTGKHKTVKSLLELGDITQDDLIDSDTSRRALVLKRKAAVIADKLRRAWSQEDIKISLDVDQQHLSILFRDGKNRPTGAEAENDTKWVWTLPENRSAGFRWFVTFYAMYLNQLSKSSNIVFLIDDAGTGLNKRAQDDLLSEFERITKNESDEIINQVIYVSHSKYMFRWDMRSQILVADKKSGIGTKIDDLWWVDFAQNELPPPLDELGVTWLDDLLKNDNLIIEGHSDGIVFQKLITIFSEQGVPHDPFKGYKLIPGNGFNGQFEVAKLCDYHKRNYLVLFDSDTAGLRAQQGAISKSLTNSDLATLADSSEKVVTAEDFIPAQQFVAAANNQGAVYFGQDWSPITRLPKAATLGIVGALEERLKKTLDHDKVDDFIDKKYFIVIEALKNISLSDFSDAKQAAVIRFFTQLNSVLPDPIQAGNTGS